MTAVEGEEILRHALHQGLAGWLGETLATATEAQPPPLTTNQFAAACLATEKIEENWPENRQPCPFLANNLCRIYAARPFACRLFLSGERCLPGGEAEMPTAYSGVAVAIGQIIEHLGQRQYWGNMLDVLLALLPRPEYQKIACFVLPERIAEARGRLLAAQALPGFLLDEEEAALAAPLFEAIFQSRVDGKTVEVILNGG
jgi:Fe-S-cluster containining protein